jgi:hypothetical protein
VGHPALLPENRTLTTGISQVLTMVSYVLLSGMVEVREYLDPGGRSPYATWSDRLNGEAAAKVAAALARMQQGNLSNAKSVGAGVYEYRIVLVQDTEFTSAKVGTGL